VTADLRLVAIGFYTPGTGLTRVMDSILRRLTGCWEIHYLGIGYAGEIVRDRGLTIYPTNRKGGDVFAAFEARRLIEEIHPRVVLILHDIWMFDHYLRVLGPLRAPLRIVAYIPLDGLIVNQKAAAPLRQADRVVVYTEYARREFENAFRGLGGEGFPAVEVIPHAVDRDRFFPYAELIAASFDPVGRAAAKRRLLPDLPDIESSFIVLNPNRPDRRKRIDLTLAGFAQFAAGKPDNVRLCLHQAFMGELEMEQIPALVGRLGLDSRVHLNPLGRGVRDDGELNLLYNACDVGINTSMGEGWGLTSMEHGAAGGAQIVPDHTACAELWRGRCELIPVARRYVPDFSVLEMGEVSPEGVAGALENLYCNRERRRELSRAAFAMTGNPAWSWDRIAGQFDELFRGLARAQRA
jgi:glycosyltransferase involved in cell wall biosynthesis